MMPLLQDDLCFRLTLTLLHFLWQGAVIGLLAFCAAWLLRRRSAAVRYVLHLTALLSLPVCAVGTFLGLSTTGAALPDAIPRSDISADGFSDLIEVPGVAVDEHALSVGVFGASGDIVEKESPEWAAGTQTAEHFDRAATVVTRAAPTVVVAWIAGACFFLLRLSAAVWGGHRLRMSSTPVHDAALLNIIAGQTRALGLKTIPLLAYCERVAVPTVIGVLRPVVLLPASLVTGLDREQLSAIIGHELAHIRRYDLITNLLQRVIESLLFFHPVVWYVSRRMSAEREACCDDLVVRSGFERMDYADALLRMAEVCTAQPQPGLTVVAASGRSVSQFEQRIRRLLNPPAEPAVRLSRSGVGILLAVFLVPVATPMILQSRAGQVAGSAVATPQPAAAASGQSETESTTRRLDADAVASVAGQVASRIEELKGRFPHLAKFSAAEHLTKNVTQEGFAPGTPGNPELYSISYTNGITGRKQATRSTGLQSVEFTYDPETGIQLFVHFFNGQSRGQDPRPAIGIGDLNVHVYVNGPAGDAVRAEVVKTVNRLAQSPVATATGSTGTSGQPRRNRSAAQLLTAYLKADHQGDAPATVTGTLATAQVITVRYQQVEPAELPFSDATGMLKAAMVTPVPVETDGQMNTEVHAVFSRLWGRSKEMTAGQWLQEMKRPVSAGFRVVSVDAVVAPSRQVMQQAFVNSQKAVQSISRETLRMLEKEHGPPESNEAHTIPGKWTDKGWPDYPVFRYRHDIGKQTRSGPEKLSDDWCQLWFGVTPIDGNPRQRPSPSRRYPRLGLMAEWSIESGDRNLNAKFSDIVVASLSELDAQERQLGGQDTAADPAPVNPPAADTPPDKPAERQPRPAPAALKLVETVHDPGLDAVTSVAVSADGKFLYTSAYRGRSHVVFSRNKDSGALAHVQTYRSDLMDGATSLRLSSDGKLAVSPAFRSQAVSLYSRDAKTGKIEFLDIEFENVAGVTGLTFPVEAQFSTDTKFVYVLDSRGGITVFRVAIDADGAELEFVEDFRNVDISGPRGLAIHPSGKYLVVACKLSHTLVLLRRDTTTGKLSVADVVRDDDNGVTGLHSAFGVTISRDGKFVYSVSGQHGGGKDNSVGVFQFDDKNEALTLVEELMPAQTTLDGKQPRFNGGNEVILSPTQTRLYACATASGSVAVMDRDKNTGVILLKQVITDKDALGWVSGLAVSPDGRFLYTASERVDGVSVYKAGQ